MRYRMPALGAGAAAILAAAQPPLPPPPLIQHPDIPPLVQRLVQGAPALREARHRLEAERAKVAPAGALPDPDLAVGLSRSMDAEVMLQSTSGHLDASSLSGMVPARRELSLMAGQSLPWPGKRAARTALAESGVLQAERDQEATILTREGDILEALLEVYRLRAQRALLHEQVSSWAAAEAVARTASELGRGTASDLLQAIQTQARLRQRLLVLEAREADLQETLASLGGLEPQALTLPDVHLLTLPQPMAPAAEVLAEDLLTRNPDRRRLEAEQASAARALELARLERRPDFRVSAGLMAERGMTPGWKAEVGFSVPLFTRRKQDHVVAQRRAEEAQLAAGQEGLRFLILQRARERARAWTLAEATARLVATELLPTGEARLQSALSRYETGSADFNAVVSALNARLSDREAHLGAVTALHRLSLQQHRAGLEPPPPLELDGGGMAPASSASPTSTRAQSSAPSAAPEAAPAMPPMKM